MFSLLLCAAVETTDLFLKLLAFLWGEGVCFGNQRDDIDFLMQPFHKLDVQGLQSAGGHKVIKFMSTQAGMFNHL